MTAAEKRKFIWREYDRACPNVALLEAIRSVVGDGFLAFAGDQDIDRIYIAYLNAKLKG